MKTRMGVVSWCKIGCGFVGLRNYNHAAPMASRHVFTAHAQMAQCVFVEMTERQTPKRLRAAAGSE